MSTIVISTRAWRALKAFALIISIVAAISVGFGINQSAHAAEPIIAHSTTPNPDVTTSRQPDTAEGRDRAPEVQPPAIDVGRTINRMSDVDCLARNIYFEARGEGHIGMKAVANVVINRVRHPRFPNTVCGVVFQGVRPNSRACQFSWACDGVNRTVNTRSEVWNQSVQIANRALAGKKPDVTRGALYFHNSTVRPRWAAANRFTVRIGGHYFYR